MDRPLNIIPGQVHQGRDKTLRRTLPATPITDPSIIIDSEGWILISMITEGANILIIPHSRDQRMHKQADKGPETIHRGNTPLRPPIPPLIKPDNLEEGGEDGRITNPKPLRGPRINHDATVESFNTQIRVIHW